MPRDIEIYLDSVAYSGDSIGQDLRFSLRVSGQLINISPRIPYGSSLSMKKLLCKETIIEDVTISALVEIVEEDLIYPDVGSASMMIPVKVDGPNEQNYSEQVEVRGDPIGDKGKIAYFLLNFRIVLHDDIRIVGSVSPGGWLDIRHEDEMTYPATLPYGVKVKVTKVENGREYFTILEGKLAGRPASVKLKNTQQQESYLAKENIHKSPVDVTFSKRSETFSLSSNGKQYAAFTEGDAILENGTYKIEIPYEKHTDFGSPYTHISKWL